MLKKLTGLLIFLMPFAAQAAEPALSVSGLVAHPLHLALADLRALPPTHVSATQVSGKGPVPLNCTGPSLSALLDKAGLQLGSVKNINLAHTLLITADDNYAVALSLGEIDPDYGNAAPIIATDCNGKPEDTPRLVMPNDKHGGRAVRGVVSIEVK
jgi:hypothetical protein